MTCQQNPGPGDEIVQPKKKQLGSRVVGVEVQQVAMPWLQTFDMHIFLLFDIDDLLSMELWAAAKTALS